MFSDTGCPRLSDLPGFYLPAPVRSPERGGSCGRRRNFRDSLPPGRLSGGFVQIGLLMENCRFRTIFLQYGFHQPPGIFLPVAGNDLIRISALHYPSLMHHQNAVTESLDQSKVMTDNKEASRAFSF